VYVSNLSFFPMSELVQACACDIINALCHIRNILRCAGDVNHVIRQYLCIVRNAGICSIYSEQHQMSYVKDSRKISLTVYVIRVVFRIKILPI
jgi:hypothetical protein